MLWTHDDHPGRAVRLAYCLNVHASEDFEEMLGGMREITLPLAQRLADGREFGVGMYFAGVLAERLASDAGRGDLDTLVSFLRENRLDPFTFNAFPYGGFHSSKLKRDVFAPTWLEEERTSFTLSVAHIATHLARELGRDDASHVSISTHTGMFGALVESRDDVYGCATNIAKCARELAKLEHDGAPRIVLSLEPEPRASCGDTTELYRFLEELYEWGSEVVSGAEPIARVRAKEQLQRHVGACLDCCHAAVEFESPDIALREATAAGGPLGKLQFSSAVRLADPERNAHGVESLLAMNEPRYLHQITGLRERGSEERLRLEDLPQLAAILEKPGGDQDDWLAADEWRCHFHVPVDLEELEGTGLATTRSHADRLLTLALSAPTLWRTDELHLEIETYTWDVLPGAARGTGDMVDGLEREYRHTIALLESAGWRRAQE